MLADSIDFSRLGPKVLTYTHYGTPVTLKGPEEEDDLLIQKHWITRLQTPTLYQESPLAS